MTDPTILERAGPATDSHLPDLPLSSWTNTKDTIHLWLQIVGKIKLAYAPPKNHWWHVTLHLDVRGITTRRIPVDATRRFEIGFDLIDHFVRVTTNLGEEERLELHDNLSVSEFDREMHAMLQRLDVDVPILETPYGVPMKTDFTKDQEHAAYDRDAVTRFWRILDWSDGVFDRFSGWFCGKSSPVQLYWHTLDLAFARYNGTRVAPRPDADPVTREAYSHEVIAFGFWAGDEDWPEPGFYSYTAPEPSGLSEKPLPGSGRWTERSGGGLAVLPLDSVRNAADPEAALLEFLQGAYEAGATAAGWDMAHLESSWCPSPDELSQITRARKEAR